MTQDDEMGDCPMIKLDGVYLCFLSMKECTKFKGIGDTCPSLIRYRVNECGDDDVRMTCSNCGDELRYGDNIEDSICSKCEDECLLGDVNDDNWTSGESNETKEQ